MMLKYPKPSGLVIEIGDTQANISIAKQLGWVLFNEGASETEKKSSEKPREKKKILRKG